MGDIWISCCNFCGNRARLTVWIERAGDAPIRAIFARCVDGYCTYRVAIRNVNTVKRSRSEVMEVSDRLIAEYSAHNEVN